MRRMETLGPAAYLNAGRQEDNIVGQMVVLGVIHDQYIVQQQHERYQLAHAGIPATEGTDHAGNGVQDPVEALMAVMRAERKAGARAAVTAAEAARKGHVIPWGGAEISEHWEEELFLRRTLQWSVQQESIATIALNSVHV
jgi:hypothetical protein